MQDPACRWLIVENAKIFRSDFKHFWIFPRERNCWILIGLCKWVFMNHPIMLLDRNNETNQCQLLFLTFYNFYERKTNFSLKSLIVITVTYNCIIKKLSKLFHLHCPCKKVVEKLNKENLKVIKNILPSKSGNPESLKK